MDLPHDDLAELLVVGCAHGEDEINVATDGEHRLDVRQLRERRRELWPGCVADFHDDQRGHVQADRLTVDLGGEALHDSCRHEILHAIVGRGAGDVYALRDGSDGQSRVESELGNNRSIDAVYGHGIRVPPGRGAATNGHVDAGRPLVMPLSYWICAAITAVSAFVSLGFSIAALRPADGASLTASRYATARSIALVVVAVVAFFTTHRFAAQKACGRTAALGSQRE